LAEEGGGWGVTGAFADVDPGGRGAALGGALAPLVDDPTAVYWNAAQLLELKGRGISATYADLFNLGLVHQTAVFLGYPRFGRATIWEDGRFTQSKSEAQSALGLAVRSTQVDLDPAPESCSEYDIALAYARRSLWGLRLGLTGRALIFDSDVEGASASGFAFDLAAGHSLSDRLDACVVLRSLLSQLDWEGGTKETLRPVAQAGVSARLRGNLQVPVTASYDLEQSALFQVAAGTEWLPSGRILTLRGGLRWRDDGDEALLLAAAGAGLRWRAIAFDYGLAMGRTQLDDTHRFSLHILF
jgi:hypothetical protein